MSERYMVQSVQLGSTEAYWVLDTHTNEAVDMPKENEEWITWRCHIRNIEHLGLQYAVTTHGNIIQNGVVRTIWGVENLTGGYKHNSRTLNYAEALAKVVELNNKVQS